MKRALAAALGVITFLAVGSPAGFAAERRATAKVAGGSFEATGGRYHRRYATAPRRHYYAARRIGFYSYSYRDVINTYGDARSRYGSINSYRDPYVDRQTPAGPFDHGFFFDSGNLPRGGNSPYMN